MLVFRTTGCLIKMALSQTMRLLRATFGRSNLKPSFPGKSTTGYGNTRRPTSSLCLHKYLTAIIFSGRLKVSRSGASRSRSPRLSNSITKRSAKARSSSLKTPSSTACSTRLKNNSLGSYRKCRRRVLPSEAAEATSRALTGEQVATTLAL